MYRFDGRLGIFKDKNVAQNPCTTYFRENSIEFLINSKSLRGRICYPIPVYPHGGFRVCLGRARTSMTVDCFYGEKSSPAVPTLFITPLWFALRELLDDAQLCLPITRLMFIVLSLAAVE